MLKCNSKTVNREHSDRMIGLKENSEAWVGEVISYGKVSKKGVGGSDTYIYWMVLWCIESLNHDINNYDTHKHTYTNTLTHTQIKHKQSRTYTPAQKHEKHTHRHTHTHTYTHAPTHKRHAHRHTYTHNRKLLSINQPSPFVRHVCVCVCVCVSACV